MLNKLNLIFWTSLLPYNLFILINAPILIDAPPAFLTRQRLLNTFNTIKETVNKHPPSAGSGGFLINAQDIYQDSKLVATLVYQLF